VEHGDLKDILLLIPRWLFGVAALIIAILMVYALFWAKCTVFIFGLSFGPNRPCDCDQVVSADHEEVELGGFKWRTEEEAILDPDGNVALGIEIDVLEDGIRWKCGSSYKLTRGDEEVDLAAVIRAYGRERELNGVRGIIAVGAASSEGLTSGQEALAQHRMERMISLLDSNLSIPKMPTYGYWAGQNVTGSRNSPCNETTSNQRRVLILKITDIREGMSFYEMSEKVGYRLVERAKEAGVVFPIDIREYSRFQKGEQLLIWGRNISPGQVKIEQVPPL
jgi:hypothetical protein